MADAYAIPDDIEGALGRPLTATELVMVEFRIPQASAMIRTQVPSVVARLADGSLDSTLVAGVVADMIARVLHNPRGVRTSQRGIDDYTTSETVDSSRSEGALYISDREAKLLRGRRGRAFTIGVDQGLPSWPQLGQPVGGPFGPDGPYSPYGGYGTRPRL